MKQKGQEGDGGMPLLFVKEDITKMKVDAIVNAANTVSITRHESHLIRD